MVDLLDMDRVKRSGSMEQRLASLEEQVGWRLGTGGSLCSVVSSREGVGELREVIPSASGTFFIL
jgi:hypothetical protein